MIDWGLIGYGWSGGLGGGSGGVCVIGVEHVGDWSGEVGWEWAFLKFHSHTTTPYPPLPLHDFHSISRAPLHPLPEYWPHFIPAIAHSAWRQRNCATPYLIILSTPKSREGRIRRGATPNSARLQPSLGHERVRMSGVVSHVTTMQLEGSRNEGGWKLVKR